MNAAKPARTGAEPPRALRIPPILLEGDEPPSRPPVEPVQKDTRASGPSAEAPRQESASLPEAYGTGKLLLVARDPHSLYVAWDLTAEQQSHYQALALNRHLHVRVHRDAAEGQLLKEVQAARDTRHSFVHVEGGGGKCVAELGYYPRSGRWVSLAVSAPAEMPPVSTAPDTGVQFATLPAEVSQVQRPMTAPVETAQLAARRPRPAPLLSTLKALTLPRIAWLPGLEPGGVPATPLAELVRRTLPPTQAEALLPVSSWSPAQERAFAEVLELVVEQHDYAGSLAIAELIQKQLKRRAAPSPSAAAGAEQPELAEIPEGISSPSGGEQPLHKGFWFNVNAELVVYGATEPNARVEIGGKAIQLRPDGTFSLRFALPDGTYELTAKAISPGGEMRQAKLEFRRCTEYQGEVGAAVGEKGLKAISQTLPAGENGKPE